MDKKYKGIEACYDITKTEYERELNRNEKLDNKINITLTFCGVIFLYCLKFLNFMAVFENEIRIVNLEFTIFLKLVYAFVNCSICYKFGKALYTLYKTIKLKNYGHLDTNDIFKEQLAELEDDQTKCYLVSVMNKAININYEYNQQRASEYNIAVENIKCTIILIIVSEFLKLNFFD